MRGAHDMHHQQVSVVNSRPISYTTCSHLITHIVYGIVQLPEGRSKLEAKDVLPNINRTQAAERATKWRFCPW